MSVKQKISFKLVDYSGINLRDIPRALKPYVKMHSSVVLPVIEKVHAEIEERLNERLNAVEEDQERWKYLQDFIESAIDSLERWPEIKEMSLDDIGVFYGDIERCVLDSEGKPFWIDFAAMNDDRIDYWKEVLKTTENLKQNALLLPDSDPHKVTVLEKLENRIKEAKLKSTKNSSAIRRSMLNKQSGEQE